MEGGRQGEGGVEEDREILQGGCDEEEKYGRCAFLPRICDFMLLFLPILLINVVK